MTMLCFEHKSLAVLEPVTTLGKTLEVTATMTSLTAKDKAAVRAFWEIISGYIEDIGKDSLAR